VKGDPYDLVTRADRDIEAYLRRAIGRRFPGHSVGGEELGLRALDSPWLWLVDPVDGTFNFATGLTASGTSIGLLHAGRVRVGAVGDLATGLILGGRAGEPLQRLAGSMGWVPVSPGRMGQARLFLEFGAERLEEWMLRGLAALALRRETVPRMIGSASVALAAVALNGGCFVGVGLRAWDVAGGVALAEAAGNSVRWWHDTFPGVHVLVGERHALDDLEPTVEGLVARWRSEDRAIA
jgi:myo-inositol-1(or 4)-monophosphatase